MHIRSHTICQLKDNSGATVPLLITKTSNLNNKDSGKNLGVKLRVVTR